MKSFSSALVTGATGFIGKALVEYLVKNDTETFCLIRDKSNTELPAKAHSLIIPEFTADNILNITKSIQVDVIFHLAAYGVSPHARDPLITANVNIVSAAALLEAAKNWNLQQFIHIGSSAEYGTPKLNALINEEHPLNPLSIYGASKVAAQCYLSAIAKQYNIPFTHLRLFGVFGPGEAESRLAPYIIKKLHANETASLSPGLQIRDFLFIEDAISALIQATKLTNKYAIYNVCSGYGITVNSIAKNIARIMEKSDNLLDFGAIPIRTDETSYLVGDNSNFINATGWQPLFNLEQGLEKTVKVIRGY